MLQSYRELWYAFTAMIFISIVYLGAVLFTGGIPGASDLFGHSLGILGFILMLMTETLYSLRKRTRSARWGRMASWLQFHIFTGLVGPFLVLLHTSWKFNGLAGVVTLFTLVIVISGFIGRYIYTAVPRTADGIVVEGDVIQAQMQEAQEKIDRWLAQQPQLKRLFNKFMGEQLSLWDRLRWGWERWRMEPGMRAQMDELGQLIERRAVLRRQLGRLAQARRLLSVWHAVHIPIGIVLFTAAFIHIGAAIYYATLLH